MILEQFNDLDKELDDGDDLTRFVGVLVRFNGNKPLRKSYVASIEAFFVHKWNNDSLQALSSDTEHLIFRQLPE